MNLSGEIFGSSPLLLIKRCNSDNKGRKGRRKEIKHVSDGIGIVQWKDETKAQCSTECG